MPISLIKSPFLDSIVKVLLLSFETITFSIAKISKLKIRRKKNIAKFNFFFISKINFPFFTTIILTLKK